MVAQSGVIALYQGAAETGPRALGHRSILANPCDAQRARAAQRARQIPRGHSPAGADGDAGSGAGIFRTAARRRGCRLQRLQLHGADGAFEAAGPRKNSGRHSRRRHRPHPDRARRQTIPSPTPISRRSAAISASSCPSTPPSMSLARSRRPRSRRSIRYAAPRGSTSSCWWQATAKSMRPGMAASATAADSPAGTTNGKACRRPLSAEGISARARRSAIMRCRSPARPQFRAARFSRQAPDSRAGSRSPESATSPA